MSRPGVGFDGARAGALALVVTLVVGAAILGTAMNQYAGGSAVEPHAAHHSWWFNYLCDLASELAVNGASNARGAASARVGMLVMSVAVALFWLLLPVSIGMRGVGARVIQIGGCLSALGVAVVPVTTGALHAPALFLSLGPGLVAGIVGFTALVRANRRSTMLAVATGAVISGVTGALVYAAKLTGHLPPTSPLIPVFQRAATMFLIAWMVAVAWAVLRPHSE